MGELSASERDAGDDEASAPLAITPTGEVDRWALLIGVSSYAHETLSLQFAARDAQKLRETLLEPTSGAFPDDHVHLLVDEDATLAGLNKALRTFLKRPAPEDLVVVFVACHGSRDRDRPDNLYLLPYDTDPADISGTALPMREVELALRETLLSTRVVVLVDACHSGGLGGQFADVRAVHDDAADLNTYLSLLSSRREGGVSLMTSAMASESSLEGEQWGAGHGVFTHFLLEGL
ncbi:MAG TPA: caspase family protein, partial [Solirubrobacteraceae bacterium]|nr:caspase family protein [Solirubrobacteraceae bacterium]